MHGSRVLPSCRVIRCSLAPFLMLGRGSSGPLRRRRQGLHGATDAYTVLADSHINVGARSRGLVVLGGGGGNGSYGATDDKPLGVMFQARPQAASTGGLYGGVALSGKGGVFGLFIG